MHNGNNSVYDCLSNWISENRNDYSFLFICGIYVGSFKSTLNLHQAVHLVLNTNSAYHPFEMCSLRKTKTGSFDVNSNIVSYFDDEVEAELRSRSNPVKPAKVAEAKKVEAVKKSEFKKISAVEPMAFDSSSKLFNPEAKVLAASVPNTK